MPLDPNKLTRKSGEALGAAQSLARELNHSQVTPEHHLTETSAGHKTPRYGAGGPCAEASGSGFNSAGTAGRPNLEWFVHLAPANAHSTAISGDDGRAVAPAEWHVETFWK